jgi:hypothetical protein
MDLMVEIWWGIWPGFMWLRKQTIAALIENYNKIRGFIKCCRFTVWLYSYWLLK